MKRFIAPVAACLIACLPFTAAALDKSQPLRIVTAFPPGGVTDIAGRIMADALQKDLGMTVVFENKPGGDGIIGMMEVVNAKPDGNTILLGGFGGQLIPPLLRKNFPVDVRTQLTFIARPAGFTNLLVVNKDLPISTVAEFIDYAKANPGALNFGSAASTSSDRLTTEMFMQATGTELTHVPYKGGTAALNDLAAGTIQFMFANMPSAMGLIEGDMLKPLAVTSAGRASQLPEVPTMQEAGVDGFQVMSWLSMHGPGGVSDADVKTLSDAFVRIMKEQSVIDALTKVGFSIIGEGSEEFRTAFEEEWKIWDGVITNAGLKEQ